LPKSPFSAALVLLPVVMRIHLQHAHGEVIRVEGRSLQTEDGPRAA
jgi:hypothetical protein